MLIDIFIFNIQCYSNMHMGKYVYSCSEICLKHNVLFLCVMFNFRLASVVIDW